MQHIDFTFCLQAKIPDIEKCLDIVAALQAKKALGEVCMNSWKPHIDIQISCYYYDVFIIDIYCSTYPLISVFG
jgi:hypothetical protein